MNDGGFLPNSCLIIESEPQVLGSAKWREDQPMFWVDQDIYVKGSGSLVNNLHMNCLDGEKGIAMKQASMRNET